MLRPSSYNFSWFSSSFSRFPPLVNRVTSFPLSPITSCIFRSIHSDESAIHLETPKDITNFINHLSTFPYFLPRTNPFNPGPLTTPPPLSLSSLPLDRHEAILQVVEYLKGGIEGGKGGKGGGVRDCGVCVVVGDRGCGKSLMIDYVLGLHDKMMSLPTFEQQQQKQNEQQQHLILGKDLNHRLIPIPLSFNLTSSSIDHLRSEQVSAYLRILHNAFFTEPSWRTFAERSTLVESVTPEAVVDVLVDHFEGLGVKKPVFLFTVDPLGNAGGGVRGEEEGGKRRRVRGVLEALVGLVEYRPDVCRVVVTETNYEGWFGEGLGLSSSSPPPSPSPSPSPSVPPYSPTHQLTNDIPSPIAWVSLPPLEPSSLPPSSPLWQSTPWYKKLKKREKEKEEKEKKKGTKKKVNERDRILRFLLALCSGHPRSLSLLHEILSNSSPLTSPPLSLPPVLQELHHYLSFYHLPPRTDSLLLHYLSLSLTGTKTSFYPSPPSLPPTLLLGSSYLLNEINPPSTPSFSPHLHPLRLHSWVSQALSPPSSSSSSPLHYVAPRLLALLESPLSRSFSPSSLFLLLFFDLRSWGFQFQGVNQIHPEEFFPSAKVVKEARTRGEEGGEDGEEQDGRGVGEELHLPRVLEGRKGGMEAVFSLSGKFSSLGGDKEREGIEPGFYLGLKGQRGFDFLFVMEDGRMVFVECSSFTRGKEGERGKGRRKMILSLYRKVAMIRKEIHHYQQNGGKKWKKSLKNDEKSEQQSLQERDCLIVLTSPPPHPHSPSWHNFQRELRRGPTRGEGERARENFEHFQKFGGGVVVMDGEGMEEGWGASFRGLGRLAMEMRG